MSIIIHFPPAPSSLMTPSTVPPACAVEAENTLTMGAGPENDPSVAIMSADESSLVEVSLSDSSQSHPVKGETTSSTYHAIGTCFGLPYQDHNYGAPPPPTPPSQSPHLSPVHTETVIETEPEVSPFFQPVKSEEVQAASVTRCVCGFDHDDEYMICCDRCQVWQHVDCMGLDRNKIPETYLCEKCEPRKVDRQKARVLQAKKKVALGEKILYMDSSDESEDDGSGKVRTAEQSSKIRSKSSKRKSEECEEVKTEPAAIRKGRSNSNHGKERMEIKRSKFRRRTKSKSESSCTADEEVQEEGDKQHEEGGELKLAKQLQDQLCRVTECAGAWKKLVAATDLPADQLIIEFKGQFLSATQFHQKNPVFRQRLFPFILLYKLRSHEELCVDASEYGNDARFVRRSCMPNAEIRHLVVNGSLHLYISSTKDIKENEEITIPFDVNYKDCIHELECACDRETCPIISHTKIESTEMSSEKRKSKRRQTVSTDDESNHSQTSSIASPTKSNKASPIKTSPQKVPVQPSSLAADQIDPKILSEEQETEEQIKERRRKMTREERKIDAIMRAFDQMEKTKKRRQQALDRLAQQKGQSTKVDESLEKPDPSSGSSKEEEKPPVTEVTTTEDEKPTSSSHQVRQKKGKKRRGSGTQSRRRTRTNSGGSDIFNTDDNASLSEISSPSCTTNTSVEALDAANSESSTFSTPSPITSVAPVLPKSKRFLLHEWLQEKESSTSSSPLPVSSEFSCSAFPTTQIYYVRCIKDSPTAGGISAAHLRRSSISGQSKQLSSQGSAKKRWLRQAMYDCEPSDSECAQVMVSVTADALNGEVVSSLGAVCFSPNSRSENGSPGVSDDVITPLKKRRLLRKSLESLSSPRSPSLAESMSPDHSSMESTADCAAEPHAIAAPLCAAVKSILNGDVSVENLLPSNANGLGKHLLKSLREKWIENDNKDKPRVSCSEENVEMLQSTSVKTSDLGMEKELAAENELAKCATSLQLDDLKASVTVCTEHKPSKETSHVAKAVYEDSNSSDLKNTADSVPEADGISSSSSKTVMADVDKNKKSVRILDKGNAIAPAAISSHVDDTAVVSKHQTLSLTVDASEVISSTLHRTQTLVVDAASSANCTISNAAIKSTLCNSTSVETHELHKNEAKSSGVAITETSDTGTTRTGLKPAASSVTKTEDVASEATNISKDKVTTCEVDSSVVTDKADCHVKIPVSQVSELATPATCSMEGEKSKNCQAGQTLTLDKQPEGEDKSVNKTLPYVNNNISTVHAPFPHQLHETSLNKDTIQSALESNSTSSLTTPCTENNCVISASDNPVVNAVPATLSVSGRSVSSRSAENLKCTNSTYAQETSASDTITPPSDVAPAHSACNVTSSNLSNNLENDSLKIDIVNSLNVPHPSDSSGETKAASVRNTALPCASATQKRKVSLSEYRQRMRENPPVAPADSPNKIKSNNCVLNPISSSEAFLEREIKLAALPLFGSPLKSERMGTLFGKGSHRKVKSSSGENNSYSSSPREKLEERLKREFGFEDEVNPDNKVNGVKRQKLNDSPSKVSPDVAPVLSLHPRLPPPPAAIPIANANNSTLQFPYQMPQSFSVSPQMSANQYIGAPNAMGPHGIPMMHQIPGLHQMGTPAAVPPSCTYSAAVHTSLPQPQQDYTAISNQGYTALPQPMPHHSLNPTQYNSFFKSKVYK